MNNSNFIKTSIERVSFFLFQKVNDIKNSKKIVKFLISFYLKIKKMYSLNINLQSFSIQPDLLGPSDDIRVSITVVPDDNKQAFVINVKKISNANHVFTVNITEATKKIIFVFRRKWFSHDDPIIASAIIHSDEFPKQGDAKNTEIKRFKLLEPLSRAKKYGYPNNFSKRMVFGEMRIQMTPVEALPVPLFESYKKSDNHFNRTNIRHKNPVQNNENNNVVFNENWVFN